MARLRENVYSGGSSLRTRERRSHGPRRRGHKLFPCLGSAEVEAACSPISPTSPRSASMDSGERPYFRGQRQLDAHAAWRHTLNGGGGIATLIGWTATHHSVAAPATRHGSAGAARSVITTVSDGLQSARRGGAAHARSSTEAINLTGNESRIPWPATRCQHSLRRQRRTSSAPSATNSGFRHASTVIDRARGATLSRLLSYTWHRPRKWSF